MGVLSVEGLASPNVFWPAAFNIGSGGGGGSSAPELEGGVSSAAEFDVDDCAATDEPPSSFSSSCTCLSKY